MSVINTSPQSTPGAQVLNRSQEMIGRSLTRLSSSLKVITPSDDPGSVAISEKLSVQSGRAKAASTNLQQAVSRGQTADGMMSGMTKLLARMSDLATLSADAGKAGADTALYQQEFSTLQDQLRDTIGGTTAEIGGTADVEDPLGSFNGVALFGASPTGRTVAIGQAAGQDVTIADSNLRGGGMLGVIQQDARGEYTLRSNQSDAPRIIQSGMDQVSTERGSLDAVQSRLELAAMTLSVEVENLSSAMAQIRDAGVAAASTQAAKLAMLGQSDAAMLAQANQAPKTVLQLLQS